ncbi:MAG: heme-degrading monooxygenase HmoA [Lentisphaeria bacterium]|jgi:heme-degrading monooxygenase HmoA
MIHVLIERHIAEGLASTYDDLSRSALQSTYVVHGFIAGETFANTGDIHHRFVLCKWRTHQDWNRWYKSPERTEIMNKIAPVLAAPDKILVLEN